MELSGVRTPHAPPAQANSPLDREIRRAAVEFESVLLGQFVNEIMKDTMPTTMNGGHGEELFRTFLGNEIGRSMAESGGIGLAPTIEEAMRAYRQ